MDRATSLVRRLDETTDGNAIAGVTHTDRAQLQRRLRRIAKIREPERLSAALDEVEQAIEIAEQRLLARAAAVPRVTYPPELPIAQRRDEIVSAIRDHQVVVIAGETGSGKSTQLPKMCLEAGLGIRGMIGHTQPRRIAARSIGARVSEELGVKLGEAVGYAVRFDNRTGDNTRIKVMTDGIVLAELNRDRDLLAYDTIIVDEAHERSLNIDFLLGYLRTLTRRRPELHVIITSATIDTERFAKHFDDAPIIEVSGRNYPVEVRYSPRDASGESLDAPAAVRKAVTELMREGPGDILVFSSGEREINDVCESLKRHEPDLEVLPLYARLSSAEQQRIFGESERRRVVVSTNVAETSLTVPGIRYVIDIGEARISRFSQRTKVQRLPIEAISQASANQRSGRCGRLGPGVAIRLYAEDEFEARPEFTEPEIQRTNLASVILTMASQGFGSPSEFPFVDPPDPRSVTDGIKLLFELGAVAEPTFRADRSWVTDRGRLLSSMPIDPRLGAMLVGGNHEGCLHEATIIAAALAVQDPRERPRDKQKAADEAHDIFVDDRSDFLTLLHLWERVHVERRSRTRREFDRWCNQRFLHRQRLHEWFDTVDQLKSACDDANFANSYSSDFDITVGPGADDNLGEDIHRAVLHGLLSQVGMRIERSHDYLGPRASKFAIQPGSACFETRPSWIMAGTLVETTRLWARSVAPIDPAWLEQPAAHLTVTELHETFWDETVARAGTSETIRLYGLPIVADRAIPLDRHDPKTAREMFIHHALIEGEWAGTRHRFWAINQSVRTEARNLAVRATQRSFDDEYRQLWAFYDRELPADINSASRFDGWYRKQAIDNPHALELSLADLLTEEQSTVDTEQFPDQIRHDDLTLSVDYQQVESGVAIDVPAAAIATIDPASFAGVMPGHRREAVIAMVRALPKPLRKQLVPVPEHVDTMLERIEARTNTPESASEFGAALRFELESHLGQPLPPDALDPRQLPPPLRPRYRVVDDDGDLLAEGSDLAELRTDLADEVAQALTTGATGVRHSGATTWEFGDISPTVTIDTRQGSTTAHPALIDRQNVVAVELLGTAAEQQRAMYSGTRRLLRLTVAAPLRAMNAHMTNERLLSFVYSAHEGRADWFEDLTMAYLGKVIDKHRVAWTADEFDVLQKHARSELSGLAAKWTPVAAELLDETAAIRLAIAAADRLPGDCVADARDHLERLVFPGHLAAVGVDRFDDVLRYLRGLRHRLERLASRPGADRNAMHQVQAVERTFDMMHAHLPDSPELEAIAWSLEELRISLFAQHLGAKERVSAKRIGRQLDALGSA